ncbi:hypothetical protein GGF42_004916 [Coemansia sp. RSA 2424]|nr:hypothetical protein GGF42_004916 [Coemansia sp. RSA 2424]
MTSAAATSKLRVLVKPLMRNVMLKIHPDFYANEPVIRQKNQDSVQRLQQLMRPVLEDMGTAHSRAELSPTFQAKITATPIEIGYRERGDSSSGSSELNAVVFSFSKTHTPQLPRLQAQRTADFLSLCSSLKIQISPSVLSDIKAAIVAVGAGAPKLVSLEIADVDSAIAKFHAAREREAKANRERLQASSINIADELTRHLRKQQHHSGKSSRDTGRSGVMLARDNVYFAPDVPPSSYARVLAHIDSKLPFLGYSSWSSLPVMVVCDLDSALKGGKPKYPGFVMIPAAIRSVQEYSMYLHANLSSIRQARSARLLAHARGD